MGPTPGLEAVAKKKFYHCPCWELNPVVQPVLTELPQLRCYSGRELISPNNSDPQYKTSSIDGDG
jgi:hypothetical protein